VRGAEGMSGARSRAGVAAAAAGLLLTACAPPGGELQDRTAKGGEKAAQLVAPTPKDAKECRVRPPDVELRGTKVGFAQVENNNPFRIAETESLKSAAKQHGIDLLVTDAQSNTPKQVSELYAIAAVVVGGTLLTGGAGSMAGSLAGLLLFGVLQNMINLVGTLTSYVQQMVSGLFLIVVVTIQTYLARKRAG
jgi:ABC-type sugar transport system substrate-binding protein